MECTDKVGKVTRQHKGVRGTLGFIFGGREDAPSRVNRMLKPGDYGPLPLVPDQYVRYPAPNKVSIQRHLDAVFVAL